MIALLSSAWLSAQWAAQPGATVVNGFGPGGSECRGACGPGCASTCTSEVRYACLETNRLRRIERYSCGTHLGCRTHDDCLDRCAQANIPGVDCDARCHFEAMKTYGVENATSWVGGGGPYDGAPIVFEYTRDAPGAPEPYYRCPEGTVRDCAGGTARCVTPAGVAAEPVFDAFPQQGAGAIALSGFRSGRLCEQTPGGARVCQETVSIQVTGVDSCTQAGGSQPCTRFGFEFDYRGANPAVPLMCTASSSDAADDFLGGVVSQGIRAMPVQDSGSDLGKALGGLQQALKEGRSLKDVFSGISVTPLGPDGKPVESARVGAGTPSAEPAPVPARVQFGAASGRLVVPLSAPYEPQRAGEVVVRDVKCSYNGAPVLETRYRLHYGK